MQPGSLVAYIGGQDPNGQRLCQLHRNTPYTIDVMVNSVFNGVVKPAVSIIELPGYDFIINMFRELQPPLEINIEEIIKEKL